jgi:hypothetical protein
MAEYNKIQNIHLKYINLYLDSKFEDQVSQVFQNVLARLEQDLTNKPQKRMLEAITKAATRIIEGLYQVYGSRNNNCGLGVPTSKSGYGKKPYQIDDLSHTAIIRVLDALQSLNWIKRRRGIKNWDGECISTSIKPFGGLLKLFQKTKYVWRPLAPAKQDVIVVSAFKNVVAVTRGPRDRNSGEYLGNDGWREVARDENAVEFAIGPGGLKV